MEARQRRARCRIEDEPRIRMFLQEACRHAGRHRAFHGVAHDLRLVLAEGQQHHAARIQDGSHAHGQCAARHVALAEEVAGRVHARDAVEGDEARAAVARRAGLVEAHVPGAADAEELEIDAAGVADGALVRRALRGHVLLAAGAVGDVDVRRRDVHVVEEVLLHEAPVALQRLRCHGPVLVQVERHRVAEREAFLAMEPHQFLVDALWRGSGGQAKHRVASLRGTFAEQGGDLRCHRATGRRAGGVHAHGNAFAASRRRCVERRALAVPCVRGVRVGGRRVHVSHARRVPGLSRATAFMIGESGPGGT